MNAETAQPQRQGERDQPLRCVGGLALAIIFCCLRAASEPARHPLALALVAAVGVLMTLVHIAGALLRHQPWPEKVESRAMLLWRAWRSGRG